MQPILSPQQIREVDIFTCQSQGISSVQLMDRACRAIFDWLLAKFPDIAGRKVVVLAGTGGNGGDAIGVACALSMITANVEVYLWTDGHRCTPDNLAMQSRAEQLLLSLHKDVLPAEPVSSQDILLDGLLGFGARGGINADLVCRINTYKSVISIDLPSGVMADGSFNPTSAVHAHHTLAIQLPKLAYFLPECDACIGQLHFLNIGLSTSCLPSLGETDYKIMSDDVIDLPRPRACYKGTFGHVLSVTGSVGMMGASILSVKAALRSGVGLLTAVIPEKCTDIMQISVPEAMVQYREGVSLFFSKEPRKPYTIVIGSGLANEEKSADILMETLVYAQKYKFPVVVDASSIHDLKAIHNVQPSLLEGIVITPHVGEFDALVGHSSSHIERIAKARSFAKEHNCVVVLKNFRTAVISADEVIFCPYGNPGMATAGSGDVLAGIIAGTIASNEFSIPQICKAVALHSKAGDTAAQTISERALIASDIIDALKQGY